MIRMYLFVFSLPLLGLVIPTSARVLLKKDDGFQSLPEADEMSAHREMTKGKKGKRRRCKKNKKKDQDPYCYPEDMPRPPFLWVEGFASRLHAGPIQRYETPIAVYQTWRLDQIMWNCVAAYSDHLLDAITHERPENLGYPYYFESETRALCMMFAVNKIMPDLVSIAANDIAGWLDDLGLESEIMSDGEITSALKAGDRTPRVIGSWVAMEVLKDMKVDGWNYDGAVRPDGTPCTAHCRPFTDTTGYIPQNSPWEITNDHAWQPLIESDDRGFFYSQEHVTPHIGFTANPVILSRDELNARQLDDPEYDYDQEVEDAIENVANLDPFKRDMVRFMDNKINIAGGMIMRLRETYNLPLEAQIFYHYGYTSTEIDVVLLAWKEKIRWDRIRPTSLVQQLGDKIVTSFAGEHAAKDWVPYNRVMPHAEFPSGSGCICIGIAQFIDAFLEDQYGDASIATTWSFEQSGDYTFNNMSELAQMCGDSRIWGGMHFSVSVPASYELCDGVGTMGYERLMLKLLGGADYSDLSTGNELPFSG